MTHMEASVVYHWTFETAQDYHNGEGIRSNLKARICYPGEALAALCEAVISVIAAFFVSLSLLIPCCGFESRKTTALALFERAGLSSLACGIGLIGLFSPWVASRLVDSCVYDQGWIPFQVRLAEQRGRETFLENLSTYLEALQNTLKGLRNMPGSSMAEAASTLSDHTFTLRQNTESLSVALSRIPKLYYSLEENAFIREASPVAKSLFGTQMRETLESIRTRAGLKEPALNDWNSLTIGQKLDRIDLLAKKVNRKANLEQLPVPLDCATEDKLVLPPREFTLFLNKEPAKAELAFKTSPQITQNDPVAAFLNLQTDPSDPAEYRLCAENRRKIQRLGSAKTSHSEVREAVQSKIRLIKTRYMEDFEKHAQKEDMTLAEGYAEQRAEAFVKPLRGDFTLRAFLNQAKKHKDALSTVFEHVAEHKRIRLQQAQGAISRIREKVASELSSTCAESFIKTHQLEEEATLDILEKRIECAHLQVDLFIKTNKGRIAKEIKSFEESLILTYEAQAKEMEMTLPPRYARQRTAAFLSQFGLDRENSYETLEKSLHQAKQAASPVAKDLAEHKEARLKQAHEEISKIRQKITEALSVEKAQEFIRKQNLESEGPERSRSTPPRSKKPNRLFYQTREREAHARAS